MLSAHDIDGLKLLRLRNPWGVEDYNGPYSDDDASRWDPSLKERVHYVDDNDGTFYIDLATYHSEFTMTSIHHDTTDMHQAYHLTLDDNTPHRADGYFCNHNNC